MKKWWIQGNIPKLESRLRVRFPKWMIENKKYGKWLWHGGGTGGYSSSITLDLDRKNAVIILSNVSGFSEDVVNISNLGSRLMEIIED